MTKNDILQVAPHQIICISSAHNYVEVFYQQKDKTTNVLSFPQIAPFEMPVGLIGDISFAYETVKQEADELEISFKNHLSHLAVHGFLHILGYDHIIDEDADEMESLEVEILSKMGIANPYQDARIDVRDDERNT